MAKLKAPTLGAARRALAAEATRLAHDADAFRPFYLWAFAFAASASSFTVTLERGELERHVERHVHRVLAGERIDVVEEPLHRPHRSGG